MHRISMLSIFVIALNVSMISGCGDEGDTSLDDASNRSNAKSTRAEANDKADTLTSTQSTFALIVPDDCDNPCSFEVETTIELAKVVFEADGWPLGESEDAEAGFGLAYTFNTPGERTITATGFDFDGQHVVTATETTTIDDPSTVIASDSGREGPSQQPTVPYFRQGDNALYPAATCQNTSIAMVLAYLGWNGKPDDITRVHGKDRAQSPAGLAAVFNLYADSAGLGKRITPVTDGSFSGLRAELDRGQPVIIHGYFTRSGHVLVVLGYDGQGYYTNDPAGKWTQGFKSGYASGSGRNVYYSKAAFESAVGTSNGSSFLPLWYHVLR